MSFIIYLYYKKKINLSFYKIQNFTYELVSTYLVGSQNSYVSDIDDIDDTYNNDIILHNSQENSNKQYEIQEFKEIVLFYISYFISIIFKVNNLNDANHFLLNTNNYDQYFIHKFINPYYNYNIDTYTFKLHILDYNIKLFLIKSLTSNYILSNEYKQCLIYLSKINREMNFIYLYLDIHTENDNGNLFLGLYNQNNIIIRLINILNDFLIFVSIIFTIIYYINYLNQIALIYIILLSFLYLYLNVIIYILFNNYIHNYKTHTNMPINLGKYGLDLQKLLIIIHDEINILYRFGQENLHVHFK